MIQVSGSTEFNTITGTNLDYKILVTDALTGLRALPSESVHCVVTSVPYWGLRSYDIKPISFSDGGHGDLGLEPTLKMFVDHIVEIFLEIKRVMHKSATCWLNIGNSYANAGKSNPTDQERAKNRLRAIQRGHDQARPIKWDRSANTVNPTDKLKPKDMTGQHWAVAFALRDAGFYLRSEIIWEKINCMPSSVTDRPCTSHETIFLLSKSEKYYYDRIAIQEPIQASTIGRNRRAVSGKSKWQAGAPGQSKQGIHRKRKHQSLDESLMRNKRTVWRISNKSFSGAHFATFPIEVPEIAIKAGTSSRGCCNVCLTPWKRILAPSSAYKQHLGKSFNFHSDDLERGQQSKKRPGFTHGLAADYKTSGWQPDCKHYDNYYLQLPRTKNKKKLYRQNINSSWFKRAKKNFSLKDVPISKPVVLDPFVGSGTTIIAGLQQNCAAIGIELSESYAQMARNRIQTETFKKKASKTPKQSKIEKSIQLSLFQED